MRMFPMNLYIYRIVKDFLCLFNLYYSIDIYYKFLCIERERGSILLNNSISNRMMSAFLYTPSTWCVCVYLCDLNEWKQFSLEFQLCFFIKWKRNSRKIISKKMSCFVTKILWIKFPAFPRIISNKSGNGFHLLLLLFYETL